MSEPVPTRFLIAGAGGLGGPIALALAGTGARLVLCDPDTVELSNLQRQVQFGERHLGRLKVDALAEVLVDRGCDRSLIETEAAPFGPDSADRLLGRADVVVDGTDSPETKFLINDRCLAAGKPFVIAAAIRWTGHVIGVRPGQDGCYRCLFEAPPADAASCASAGVIGAAVGLIAGHAARLALQAGASGSGAPAELLVWDHIGRSATPRVIQFHRRRGCPACAGRPRLTVKEAS